MVCRPLPAAAATAVAMLLFMLVVVPVEAQYKSCDSSDVLPAGATFSSPALVVDFK